MNPTDLALKIAALFAGDLLTDGDVDPKTVELAAGIALAAALEELPDTLNLGGKVVPVGLLAELVLKPAIMRGVRALIEATKPARVVVTNPGSVSGTIHD